MIQVVITLVSILATLFTVGSMFCGVPICLQIRKQGHVGDISGFPFITGVLVTPFWFQYGLFKNDIAIISINSVAFVFMLSYAMFFLYHSKPKKNYLCQLSIILLIVASMFVLVQLKPDVKLLGIVATILNMINFGAPLAGLRVVLRDREVSSLPLPWCSVQFLVTFLWSIYGILCMDVFLVIPAASGMILSAIQLFLFLIFPRTKQDLSPLETMAHWFTGRNMELKNRSDQVPFKI